MNEEVIIDIENPKDNDLISRQAALDIFGYVMSYWKEHAIDVEPHEIEDALIEQYEFTAKQLSELPPIPPQPKTGHWIIKDGKEQGYDIGGVKAWYIQIMCDKCGFIKTAIEGHTGQYHYCPNCGAKMQEVEG